MSADPIIEKVGSRETTTGPNPSVKVSFLVYGTEEEPVVRELVLAYCPLWYPGTRKIRRLRTHQVHLGGGVWNADADYGLVPKPKESGGGQDGEKPGKGDPLGPQISVDISAATQHITQSLRTVAKAKLTSNARTIPDHMGAIAVSKEGGVVTVKGCDIPIPQMSWTETWTINSAFVTWGYLRAVADLVGRTNDDIFRTFEGGEVMFFGANLTPFGDNEFKCVYSFKRSPNVTVFNLLPGWDTISFTGWQFKWIDYEQDVTGKVAGIPTALGMVPRALYVEEVGRPGKTDGGGNNTNQDSFSKLLIGA